LHGPERPGGLGILLRELAELFVELVDTASRVNEFHLAREKRMAVCGNFHLYEWVLVAVFPLDGFLAAGARFAQEHIVRGDVLEYYGAVVGWMNIFFHAVKAII
jgi:hypothetical protein